MHKLRIKLYMREAPVLVTSTKTGIVKLLHCEILTYFNAVWYRIDVMELYVPHLGKRLKYFMIVFAITLRFKIPVEIILFLFA